MAEIEVKLATASNHLQAMQKAPLLRNASRPRARLLDSVYFDTPHRKLRKHGISWRIRREGESYTQTIKCERPSVDGMMGRGEWEAEVAGPEPDLVAARRSDASPLLPKKLRRNLKPVFETQVERKALSLRSRGSEVELSFDEGCVRTEQESEEISELEIELKAGSRAELFRLAREFARTAPVRLMLRSKAARGYGLIDGRSATAAKAGAVELRRRADAVTAFARIAESCLRQVIDNWEAVNRADAEGIHEMRIGLRRLRAALSLFKDLLQGPELANIKAGLKWLTDELASARQLDVLETRAIGPMRASKASIHSFDRLDEEMARRRGEAEDRAKATISSVRFRDLLPETAEWIETGSWRSSIGDHRMDRLAREMLSRRAAKLLKRGRKLRELSVGKRHKLRIAAKKLRYGVEFFADLFPKARARRARKDFLHALKRLQGRLGSLNDIAAHQQYCVSLARETPPANGKAEIAFLAGAISAKEEARIDALLRASERAYDDLIEARTFWKS
jgi:inorganic triphosphatase YgiF